MLKCFENGSIKKAAIAKSILITIDSLFLGPVYMEVGTPGGEVTRWGGVHDPPVHIISRFNVITFTW